jgi:hypothetical protein
VGFAFNSNATGLAAPDSRIFRSLRREHAPAFGIDRACRATLRRDRAFVEMIGLGSSSQPTGLKADRPGAQEAARSDVTRERRVPCTALRSAPERALTVDHMALKQQINSQLPGSGAVARAETRSPWQAAETAGAAAIAKRGHRQSMPPGLTIEHRLTSLCHA